MIRRSRIAPVIVALSILVIGLTISFAYRGRTYLRTLQFRDACALVGRTRTITTVGARGDVTGVVTFVLASGGRTQRFRARYAVRRRVVTYRLV